jgi:hypothetical protein
VGDFNNDGKADLMVTITDEREVEVLINDSVNGSVVRFIQSAIPVGLQPYDLGVADFNGDGRLDAAVTNFGDGTVSVLENTGATPMFVQSVWQVGLNPYGLWGKIAFSLFFFFL